ncbi:P-loop containing nucleoside triphosphate hydrolase [Apiospora rasikravindrae]|uniref:P-loop containing nucleoside triphosphate hydrolase n=1 Tax=Apiospora rasikravindrae TaxID=990691 RepID=A0ABR1RZB7_9PEZI
MAIIHPSAPAQDTTSSRALKLSKLFKASIHGKRPITNASDAKLFLESAQNDGSPGKAVETIVTSSHGLDCVRASVRADVSPGFIKTSTLSFTRYISAPAVKALADGRLLWQIVLVMIDPPTMWQGLIKSLDDLDHEHLHPFAWLIHEIISSTDEAATPFLPDIKAAMARGKLQNTDSHEVRAMAYKIQKAIDLKTVPTASDSSYSPGGRHDNDFADYRSVSLWPTTDEFLASAKPFLRRASDIDGAEPSARASMHLDNQFRLLREDMLQELREDYQVIVGKKKPRRPAQILCDLALIGLDAGDDKRGKKCSITVECRQGLGQLSKLHGAQCKRFLEDNKNYLKHQSFGALVCGKNIYGFAFIDRNVDLLCMQPPVVCLQFTDSKALGRALLALRTQRGCQFVLVETPVFAYEPVLKGLQNMTDLPLHELLLDLPEPSDLDSPLRSAARTNLINKYKNVPDCGTDVTIGNVKRRVDVSQVEAFVAALTNPVALIQGPPGKCSLILSRCTGKSFVGSWIVKSLYDNSKDRILVISYTNHALDQFLEELMDANIPADQMVRLGSKYTDRTLELLLSKQTSNYRRKADAWALIDKLKDEWSELHTELQSRFSALVNSMVSFTAIMEHLEFSDDDSDFYQAFTIPTSDQDWRRVDKKGKGIQKDYLFRRWCSGGNPGVFTQDVPPNCNKVWNMDLSKRTEYYHKWYKAINLEQIEAIEEVAQRMDSVHERVQEQFNERDIDTLRSKRIIGCTTTAAAMYTNVIRAANPDIVLVEEAGEIQEAHILTALAPSVKQLILIGDHKQLRPKINNYALSVEKGDGYNLNMSMFERLIEHEHAFQTLMKQHRMHPNISLFPRALTYPGLLDGPKTADRPSILGLQDRVVFFNHEQPETTNSSVADKRDPTVKASKENQFEAQMVVGLVKYLAQQGYGTRNMVILTPYLGQLRLLREALKNENDPVLNDLDSGELLRAGLITQAASKVGKSQIRLSTIDNYQGEESDIVIASLTRGNEQGDIGFMSAPERLNVLISRARNCLIMIGNMDTFTKSRKGTSLWTKFFALLKENKHLYDGIPVKCEQHPETRALIRHPADYAKFCPDGGCAESCGVQLNCGQHICQRRCHRERSHKQVDCTHRVDLVCDRQHKRKVACSKRKDRCDKCIKEDEEQERRIKRDLELERKRLERQKAYARELQEIQDELDHEKRKIKYMAEEDDEKSSLAKQREELKATKESRAKFEEVKKLQKERAEAAAAKKAAASSKDTSHAKPNSPSSNGANVPGVPTNAQEEWEHLKRTEGVQNAPLDELMDMIGLEDVKTQFLEIKSEVDTKVRQGVDFSKQRFGSQLLGNPGTGKTTVARIYARFLTSLGVLPGSNFEETTGAKLANIGVGGCQKLVDNMLNKGGGVFFIDEAYQLTSGNSAGGGAVLDYLLAEVENLTGKIVFLLAGYDKQMESFLAHNPGLPSRFPTQMKFVDYTDKELLNILKLKIDNQYNKAMKCEDGPTGLYCRIVARRIGRGRGKEGFGNARTVENVLARISKAQASRLRRERRKKSKPAPDDFLFTKLDLIGPRPADALAKSEGWTALNKLIGLDAVKQNVKSLVDSATENYDRELAEEALVEYSLNKVFLGNPGTGKTTVAKIYGKILVDLGMLSKGEVVVKNPADFIDAVIGGSEKKAKGILASTVGKVLLIDEAYGLHSHTGSHQDPFKTAVIDTIVAEVQFVPGDDRCVLLLGYKEQMQTMLESPHTNPGLARRFPIASAFNFENFDDQQLLQILNLKLKQQNYEATGEAKNVALEMLNRARNRPNFGNAGEIDIMLDATKARHQARLSKGETTSRTMLEARDFDENFDRAEMSETNVKKLFEGTIGTDDTVALLEGYQQIVRAMKLLDMDPKESIPFNFLFKGPPGTGKTTTARKMGKVFYDMGFLATAEVVEASASDLVAQYTGQTGPKVRALFERALGKVLFVDEAYRLAEGHFAQEAIDEIVDCVTKERYYKKMIIILAGYEKDIDRLTSVNEGLSSRFPEAVMFRSLNPEECVKLMVHVLQSKTRDLEAKNKNKSKAVSFNISQLVTPRSQFSGVIEHLFLRLSHQAGWANARDVKTLAESIFSKTIKSKDGAKTRKFVVDEEAVLTVLRSMVQERESRSNAGKPKSVIDKIFQGAPASDHSTPPPTDTSTNVDTNNDDAQSSGDDDEEEQTPPDAVWEQLQRDKRAEQEREDEYQRLLEDKKKAASDADREKIVRRLLEEDRKRKEEEACKKKLEQLGLCPAGFQWVKQDSGYRCTAGGHFVHGAALKGL